MRFIAAAVLLVALSACTPPPNGSSGTPASAPPSDPDSAVKSWMARSLKDPYSVRDFTMTEVRSGGEWLGIQNGGLKPRHYVCATFNAKNGFGAYGGLTTYAFFFEGDEVARASKGPDEWHDASCS